MAFTSKAGAQTAIQKAMALLACEATLAQFPVLQASQGLRQLLNLSEDHGALRTCKEKIAQEAKAPREDVAVALRVMASAAERALHSDQPALLIGQRDGGELFVCELSFVRTPMGWSYFAGPPRLGLRPLRAGLPRASQASVLWLLESTRQGIEEFQRLCRAPKCGKLDLEVRPIDPLFHTCFSPGKKGI